MEILIGADIMPTLSNMQLFKDGKSKEILGDHLYERWRNADVRLFNLEVPLSDQESPIAKKEPSLIAPTSTIEGINNLNPTLVYRCLYMCRK